MNQETLKNFLVELDAVDKEIKEITDDYNNKLKEIGDPFDAKIDELTSKYDGIFEQMKAEINKEEEAAV